MIRFLKLFNKKIEIEKYIVYCIILTYIYLLSVHAMSYFDHFFHETTYTDITSLFIFGLILFVFVIKLHYPLVLLGFNLNQWKRYIIETIAYSILFCVFVTFLKWILVKTIPSVYNLPLINFELVQLDRVVNLDYSKIFLNMAIYVLLLVPIQVFVVHSAVQSIVIQFLKVKHASFLSIVVASLWFSVNHLSLPYGFALTMLLPGFFVSIIYGRQQSLLSVWVAHAIIGIWGLFFLDLANFLAHLTHRI